MKCMLFMIGLCNVQHLFLHHCTLSTTSDSSLLLIFIPDLVQPASIANISLSFSLSHTLPHISLFSLLNTVLQHGYWRHTMRITLPPLSSQFLCSVINSSIRHEPFSVLTSLPPFCGKLPTVEQKVLVLLLLFISIVFGYTITILENGQLN